MIGLILTHLTGIYPRSERLVEVTRAFDRGRASKDDVKNATETDLSNVIGIQKTAGLDLIVDGQLDWQDIFRPFSEILTGITPGSLTRWFDNNTFYRKPIVKDKVRVGNRTTIGQYFRSDGLPAKQKKAILPGPFTLAAVSQNEAYSNLPDLIDDLAHAIREIVVELRRLGYDYVQFSEPYLRGTTSKADLNLAKNAYDTMNRGAGQKSIIHTYFSDVDEIIVELLNFTVDCIGLDLYATPIEPVLQYSFTKELNCGCVDGRNSLIESAQDLGSLIGRIRNVLNPKAIYVSPNCDLEFLPYPVAEKKVRLLTELKRRVS
jgi:5-methyltetrahydropteroyltriglutamate--homocysteine methyltransferase